MSTDFQHGNADPHFIAQRPKSKHESRPLDSASGTKSRSLRPLPHTGRSIAHQQPRLARTSNAKMSYLNDQSHGNYRHYYVRRRANDEYPLPFEQDERLQLLDSKLFRGKLVLDVGCNSGEVSVELGMAFITRKG